MTMLTTVAHAMQTLLTSVADQAARASGFRRRRSKLGGAAFVQTLVFGCLAHPRTTLEDLSQTAAACGTPVYPQALDQRFSPQAADCLRQVLAAAVTQVITAEPVALPLLRQFTGVFLEDSTTIVLPDALREHWPGCGGGGDDERGTQAALKLQVRFDCLRGQLSGPIPVPGRATDQATALPIDDLPAGSLRLADLGYFNLEVFERLQERGVWWLSRWQPGTKLWTAAGEELTLPEGLHRQQGRHVDVAVQVGARRLRCRLVAFRVPAAVADKRRQRLRQRAQKKGKKVSALRLALCDWNLFLTNVPVERLNVAEVSVLARLRWQIELLFKLWKSDGRIDEVRSSKPWRVLCEVLAKLIGVVVQHWLLLVSCWAQPQRSLRKAARVIRRLALVLASGMQEAAGLERGIAVIKRCLQGAAKINKRRKDPASHQLLQEPTVYGEKS